jgi:hypothetical protein
LRHRKLAERARDRPEQLMGSGEGDLRLGLDAERLEDAKAFCSIDRVFEQRALAHSGFAAENKRPASALPGRVQHRLDPRALTLPAEEHFREA